MQGREGGGRCINFTRMPQSDYGSSHASARIRSGRLARTIRIGIEPRLGIGRGQANPAEPIDFFRVLDQFAVGSEIMSLLARALAGNASSACAIRH